MSKIPDIRCVIGIYIDTIYSFITYTRHFTSTFHCNTCIKHISAFTTRRKPFVAPTRVIGQVVTIYPISAFNTIVGYGDVLFIFAYGESIYAPVAASDADCHVVLCLSVLLVLLSAAGGDAKAQAQRRYCT